MRRSYKKQKHPKNIVILSISSDIGFYLGKKYLTDGNRVIGTYRNYGKLSKLGSFSSCSLIKCDLTNKKSIHEFIERFKKLNIVWDTFISCVGDLRPLKPFFKGDFEEWEASVEVNSLLQMQILHSLYPFRNIKGSQVVFFAGGGVNKAVFSMSAYTISKIMLIKMCEFLDAENDDMSIFIVGPGWVKTKIHDAVLKNVDVSRVKYNETVKRLKGKDDVSLQKIYKYIRWLTSQDKKTVSGRNFSLAYDPLDEKGRNILANELLKDKDMYKLRRFKTDFRI